MDMFRLSDKVPSVYAEESRDFRLLCNLFDLIQNSTKFEIDNITRMLDTATCNDGLVKLLQTKLGFFTAENAYNISEIREILKGFLIVIRNKGSRKGVKSAVDLFIKAKRLHTVSAIEIVNTRTMYRVLIRVKITFEDTRLLDELLRYVLPAGYSLEYQFYTSSEAGSEIGSTDTVDTVDLEYVEDADYYNSRIVAKQESGQSRLTRNQLFNIGGVSTATIKNEGD